LCNSYEKESFLCKSPCSSNNLVGLGMRRIAYVDPRRVAEGELTPQINVDALGLDLPGLVDGTCIPMSTSRTTFATG
jgi:hypothetical protein